MIAASLVLGAHLATAHVGSQADGLRFVTPGVYARLDSGLTVGAYSNSYGRGSVYAGWTVSTPDGRFSLTAGAVTGYPARSVLPLLAPSVRFDLGDGYAARLAFIPKPPGVGRANGLHFMIERGF